MNAENKVSSGKTDATTLLHSGFAPLIPLASRLSELDSALAELVAVPEESVSANARKLRQGLRQFEPTVTMIGQVKAGKTSLVNAMVGLPGLLPADVNPWTSVVTSLHMSARPLPEGQHASFRFFSEDEWNRLVERGGRVGELAQRANAEDELEKVRRQLEEMRAKSRARLGRKFELLLGQTHDYGYFDDDLIQRYVCLGDDFEDDGEVSKNQGRFADITRSADLWMHQPALPIGLCIRDTPGVNDTFMIREQITIHAIRESRLCVVVLSAHQALSSVDMALIRLISNIRSREVVIFVNRIDELGDPAKEVPEIRDSIRKTLKDHQGPTDATIIFGSAWWANKALTGEVEALGIASASALLNWAEATLTENVEFGTVDELVWGLSGVPELYRVLSDRIAEGVGAETLSRAAKTALNLCNGVAASDNVVNLRVGGNSASVPSPTELIAEMDGIAARHTGSLASKFASAENEFALRLDRAHASFIERATGALIKHLETFGEDQVWQYDPAGLRILLKTAYQVHTRNTESAAKAALESAAAEVRSLYVRAFRLNEGAFKIEVPGVPRSPAPILLGQTIALDIKGNWWTRWWRRQRSYRAYAAEFSEMIRAETDPIVSGLQQDHAQAIRAQAEATLREFLTQQRALLSGLAGQASLPIDELRRRFETPERRKTQDAIRSVTPVLSRLVA